MIAVLLVSHFGDICYERIAGVQFIFRATLDNRSDQALKNSFPLFSCGKKLLFPVLLQFQQRQTESFSNALMSSLDHGKTQVSCIVLKPYFSACLATVDDEILTLN